MDDVMLNGLKIRFSTKSVNEPVYFETIWAAVMYIFRDDSQTDVMIATQSHQTKAHHVVVGPLLSQFESRPKMCKFLYHAFRCI